jgi:hypothetical protein
VRQHLRWVLLLTLPVDAETPRSLEGDRELTQERTSTDHDRERFGKSAHLRFAQ